MPALRHGQKGRLCGGRKSSVERRLRSAGRSVPERSDLEPTPPPLPLLRLPLSSPLASLQGMGGGRRRSLCAVAPVPAPGHASCCPGSGRAPWRPRPSRSPGPLQLQPVCHLRPSGQWRPQLCVLKRRPLPAQREACRRAGKPQRL